MPVLLLLGNVFLDLGTVLEPVGGDFVGESDWMMEDVCPLLNSGDIIIHSRASVECIWKCPEDCTNMLESRNGVEMFEVIKSRDSLVNEWLVDLHAVLDLVEVIVTSETEDEASSEFWDGVKRWEGNVMSLVSKVV